MSINVPKFSLNSFESIHVKQEDNKNDSKEEKQLCVDILPILILHTRDLKDDELKILSSFGNLLIYDQNKYAGIPIEIIINRLKPDYVLLDIRNREHKTFFLQISNKDDYKKIGLLCRAEKYHTFFDEIKQVVDNVIFKLPTNVAFKDRFDIMLLSRSISVPGFLSTGLGCCLNFLDSFKINQDQ